MLLRLTRVFVGAVVVLAAAFGACSGGDRAAEPVSTNTGVDAQPPRKDSGSAMRDAGAEPETDGGEWAHLTGVWDPIPNSPGCKERIARSPNADVPKLAWQACASRAGCKVAPANWSSVPGSAYVHQPMELVRMDQTGKPHLFLRRTWPSSPYNYADKMMSVVQTLDDTIEFALAVLPVRTRCGSQIAMHESGLTHLMTLDDDKLRFRTAPWANLTTMTDRTSISTLSFASTGSAGTFVSSNTAAYVGVAGPYRTVAIDFATGTAHEPPGKPYTVAETDVPDGALVEDLGYDGALNLFRPNGSLSLLISPPAGKSIAMFRVDRSRMHTIVWIEASAVGPFEGAALYVSPYATTAGGIARRRVTAIEDQTVLAPSLTVNAGYALIFSRAEHLLLVRLSDGMGWTIDAEPNRPFAQTIWVDQQHVWALAGTQAGTAVDPDSVFRIDIASLGPPNVLPR
jgi:hypothetical protein